MDDDSKKKKDSKDDISKDFFEIIDLAHKKSPNIKVKLGAELSSKLENLKKTFGIHDLIEISEKYFTLFHSIIEIIQNFINLLDYWEERKSADQILVLIKGIRIKIERNFQESSITDKLKVWIEKIEKLIREKTIISENLYIEMEFKVLEWLSELIRTTQSYLKSYEKTFQEQKTEIKQFYKLIEEKNPIITNLEKKYIKEILQYLLVIEKNSGVLVFEYNFGETSLNPNLVSGFLIAIQYFGLEIYKEETSINKLTYKNVEIVLDEKDQIICALILKGSPTEGIIKNLKLFISEFEVQFGDMIKNQERNTLSFKPAENLIKKYFLHIYFT